MSVRADAATLPAFLLKFFMAPMAFGALFASATALLQRRVRRPPVQHMSEEWLRSYENTNHHDLP